MEHQGKRKRRREEEEEGDEECSSSSNSSSVIHREQAFSPDLDADGDEFANVVDVFLRGLGVLLDGSCIRRVCRIAAPMAVMEAFERRQLRMAKQRASAGPNLHWAWYGAPREEIASICKHGFGMACASSIGYCFAPLECSRISAVQASVDEEGEQHTFLCQVVLGKVGLIAEDSTGLHHDFDTGTYDLENPRSFIIPENRFEISRVLPLYAVTFKLKQPWQEVISASRISGKRLPLLQTKLKRKVSSAQTINPSPDYRKPSDVVRVMSFPTLFVLLKTKLSPESLDMLRQHYLNFKAASMPRQEFITEVRRIVGDSLLYKCICFIKLLSQGSVLIPLFEPLRLKLAY